MPEKYHLTDPYSLGTKLRAETNAARPAPKLEKSPSQGPAESDQPQSKWQSLLETWLIVYTWMKSKKKSFIQMASIH